MTLTSPGQPALSHCLSASFSQITGARPVAIGLDDLCTRWDYGFRAQWQVGSADCQCAE